MSKKMLVADLLCGAGGSSTGAARALKELGLEMDLVCLNHWPVAIDTHQRNHPEARHYVQDIATVRPHLIVPEGYLDLLMASPTCTHHSVARGGKPTSDQQRSDPWHIITWLTELRVKRIIIENVWEFTSWGPVDTRTGKPIKSRKGEYFDAWIAALRALGFKVEWRKLNAADYGDATTRQRFILMGRSDGKAIVWPTPTHAKRSAPGGLFDDALLPWRPARDIIDWSIKGKSILNRKKPLAPKTLARIYAGATKFGWPEPFLVVLRNHMAAQGMDVPLPTIAANGNHIGIAQPVVMANRTANAPRSPEDPTPPFTTAPGGGVLIAEPVIVNMKGRSTASSSEEPLPTQTAHAPHLFKAEPILLSQHNTGAPRSADDPLSTITTGGAAAADHAGCARPMLVTVSHGNSAGDETADVRRSHSVEEPIGAVHAGGNDFAVVEPFVLSRQAEGAPRSVDEPTPAQVAKHSHLLITSYYGASQTAHSGDEPLPTVTTKDRFGMVVPVTHGSAGGMPRSMDDPIPTITTAKGGEFAVVVPLTHAGGADRVLDPGVEPLPTVTGANRGELAFITAQHGERQGQDPRVHDINEPAPTIAASGHVDLIEPDQECDILFRMLEPHELAAAMGFTTDDEAYDFAGTKTEKVKQIGNAVSVRKMKACVGALMADAAPAHKTDDLRAAA